MSYLDLNEPVVAALQARLQEELAGVITEINAANTDDLVLDAPSSDAILDYVPVPEQLTSWPTVGIQDLPSTIEDDIGSSFTGVYGLAVVIFSADADQRLLAVKLRRYAQAVATTALRSRQLGPAWITLRSITPGPTLDVEESPRTWVSWTAVAINAKVI
jgi:hypothetical protein